MTIKDFKDMTGRSDRTIRRSIQKVCPGLLSKGVFVDLDEAQSSLVFKDLRIKTLPNIGKNAEVTTQTDEVKLLANMVKEMLASIPSMIKETVRLFQAPQSNIMPALPEPPVEWFEITGYCKKHHIELEDGESSAFGRRAAAMSRLQNIAMKEREDARYGVIKRYHVSILDKVFEGLK